MIALAAIFSANFFLTLRRTEVVKSPVGAIRTAEAGEFRKLFAQVAPGQGIFVHPYMPVHYFLTQGKNPTRFSFLAPGMMPDYEAAQALSELERNPPEWLMYMKLDREEFLRVFPHASALKWRFDLLEDWLDRNYEPAPDAVNVWGYRLYRFVT